MLLLGKLHNCPCHSAAALQRGLWLLYLVHHSAAIKVLRAVFSSGAALVILNPSAYTSPGFYDLTARLCARQIFLLFLLIVVTGPPLEVSRITPGIAGVISFFPILSTLTPPYTILLQAIKLSCIQLKF